MSCSNAFRRYHKQNNKNGRQLKTMCGCSKNSTAIFFHLHFVYGHRVHFRLVRIAARQQPPQQALAWVSTIHASEWGKKFETTGSSDRRWPPTLTSQFIIGTVQYVVPCLMARVLCAVIRNCPCSTTANITLG